MFRICVFRAVSKGPTAASRMRLHPVLSYGRRQVVKDHGPETTKIRWSDFAPIPVNESLLGLRQRPAHSPVKRGMWTLPSTGKRCGHPLSDNGLIRGYWALPGADSFTWAEPGMQYLWKVWGAALCRIAAAWSGPAVHGATWIAYCRCAAHCK